MNDVNELDHDEVNDSNILRLSKTSNVSTASSATNLNYLKFVSYCKKRDSVNFRSSIENAIRNLYD